MTHLFINRDYPPCSYPHGGIGTYVSRIAPLLAARGDTVHVITQLWPRASRSREETMGGRLIVHRVSLDEPVAGSPANAAELLTCLGDSDVPAQAFAWQAAVLAESLVARESIEVIEAQEYEAPLYFLLLRRVLGLSTARPVPAIVHLHTGTEFAFIHNGYQNRKDFLPAKRLEDYTIQHADALLCPSRFLARLAARQYHLDESSIAVIPYPVGLGDSLIRDAVTWAAGTICYVGRLEPRKGVSEWIDAAVAVARDNPALQFTLIGNDAPYENSRGSTRDVLQCKIPAAQKSQFTFIDFLPTAQIAGHLARARLAVVPSRFDNFPNTCIEAMASGLPVLATPTGGMAEMIEDGRTGWIADGCDAASLEGALRRALATPPASLAAMGTAASAAIRTLCDNERTLDRHRKFKREVLALGIRQPGSEGTHVTDAPARYGVAIVVDSRTIPRESICFQSLLAQTTLPAHVAWVTDAVVSPPVDLPPSWRCIQRSSAESAQREVLRLSREVSGLLAITLVDDTWTLGSDYVAWIERTFNRLPDTGLAMPWHYQGDGIIAPLPLALESQPSAADVPACASFRAIGVAKCATPLEAMAIGEARASLAAAILEHGWRATPLPVPLARHRGARTPRRNREAAFRVGGTLTPLDIVRAPREEWRRLVRRACTDPIYVVQWLTWHGRRALRRVAGGRA